MLNNVTDPILPCSTPLLVSNHSDLPLFIGSVYSIYFCQQNEMEVTTIHVLGLADANGGVEGGYDSSFVSIPVETLEVRASLLYTSMNFMRKHNMTSIPQYNN